MKACIQKCIAFGLVMLCFAFSPTSGMASDMSYDDLPLVFLGDHDQAAITFYINHAKRTLNGAHPTIKIKNAWNDGNGGLYFIAGLDSDAVYHWTKGDAEVTIADSFTSDLLLEETPQLFTGATYPLPPFEKIDWVVSLGDSIVALVSINEGISIVNTTLTQTNLCIDAPYVFSAEDCFAIYFFFQMANADIKITVPPLKRDWMTQVHDYVVAPLEEFIGKYPGMTDIYSASIWETERAYHAGLLADLSESELLSSLAESRISELQRFCGMHALPYELIVNTWWIEKDAWEMLGNPSIPKTVEELFIFIDSMTEQDEPSKVDAPIRYMYFDENYILAGALVRQYIVQFAKETEPLSFNTPILRDVMVKLRALADYQRLLLNILSFEEALNMGKIEWLLSNISPSSDVKGGNYIPIVPPAYEDAQNVVFPYNSSVYVVDANSKVMPAAYRFLEFVASVRSPDHQMLIPFWDIGDTLAKEYEDFFYNEAACHLSSDRGVDYFGIGDGNYYDPCGAFYKYLDGGLDDIDSILASLDEVASVRYEEFCY